MPEFRLLPLMGLSAASSRRFRHPPRLLLFLLPLLRVAALLLPFLLPLFLWRPSYWPLLPALTLLLSLLLASPAVEERLIRRFLPASTPSERQMARVRSLVRKVAVSVPVSSSLRLLVLAPRPSDSGSPGKVPYAAMFGSSVLLLSQPALELEDDLLSALLAHELAHAAFYHGYFAAAESAMAAVSRSFRRLVAAVALAFPLLSLLLFPLLLALWVLVLPLLLLSLLTIPVRWWSEFSADETAAQAGFSEPLARLLSGFLSGSFRDRIPSRSHPPLSRRIARLRRSVL